MSVDRWRYDGLRSPTDREPSRHDGCATGCRPTSQLFAGRGVSESDTRSVDCRDVCDSTARLSVVVDLRPHELSPDRHALRTKRISRNVQDRLADAGREWHFQSRDEHCEWVQVSWRCSIQTMRSHPRCLVSGAVFLFGDPETRGLAASYVGLNLRSDAGWIQPRRSPRALAGESQPEPGAGG